MCIRDRAGTTAVGNIIGQGISTIGAGIQNYQAQKALGAQYGGSGGGGGVGGGGGGGTKSNFMEDPEG